MRIIGHGVDLVECARVAEMAERYGERFMTRVYTPAEIAYCGSHKRQAERLAGRFAVKEAVLKALGSGWRNGIAWTDMEVVNDPAGRPLLRLSGETKRLADSLAVAEWHISISHAAGLAIASAIALGT